MTKQDRIDFLQSCTKRQRDDYFAQVAKIGCIVCGKPAELHHCRGYDWPIKRLECPVIPLCTPGHHRGSGSIHDGKETFEALHGDQEHLLKITESRINGKN